MKLRQKPDDFIVREIPSEKWNEKGKYAVYEITKVGLTTYAAQKIFANKCKIPFKSVGVTGLKDTHAKTTQYFTARTGINGDFTEPHMKSSLVGYTDQPLKTGNLKGNAFKITVRSLGQGDIDKAEKNAMIVKQGVPNYFDSQRFGCLKGTTGFIAKDILNGDYETALRKTITSVTRQQSPKIKKARRYIELHWGDWNSCLREAGRVEEPIIRHLSKYPNDYKGAFHKIFFRIRELYFSAYKSYIWNECVKILVKEKSSEVFGVNYEAGKLTFPRTWIPVKESFPLISPEIENPIVDKVLRIERITKSQLKTEEYDFKPQERAVTLVPENFTLTFEDDERTPNRKKATVDFTLSKGAYATVILKALFEQ